jgi:Tfp pilus assembly protein PilN
MSAKKNSAAAAAEDGHVDLIGLGAARSPQVNLLPAEIRAGRVLGRVKGWLAVVLVATAVLAAVGFVGSALVERSAADELAAKQAEVQALVAQQSKYAEVPLVKTQITQTEAARRLGMSTEVLWKGYLGAIQAVTPPDVTISKLTTELPSPVVLPAVSVTPLLSPSLGSIGFVGQARTLPDVSAWMEALDTIPGFADATCATATLTDADGVVYYEIATTVQVNDVALASRFVAEASK